MQAGSTDLFDVVVVVGGGPAGATAADDLARKGRKVLLLGRAGRIKPCGGAIPPRLMRDVGIPESLLAARAYSACMVSPADLKVDIPIEGGCVDMVDREHFDKRRERFVAICKDKDVQPLTFDACMNKRLVRKKPMAHGRIFFEDMAHLLGLARV